MHVPRTTAVICNIFVNNIIKKLSFLSNIISYYVLYNFKVISLNIKVFILVF
jgi:hypothetical protein